MFRYHEITVPGHYLPLELVDKLIGSSLFDEYVVYESAAQWLFAGNAFAQVIVDRSGVHTTLGGETTLRAWRSTPMRQVAEALADLPLDGWNAYGWAAFEFGHALTGRLDLVGDQPLLQVIVPRTEIRRTASGVVIRAVDEEVLDQVRHLISAPVPARPRTPSPVDVRSDGAEEYKQRVAAAVRDINAGLLRRMILSRSVPIHFPVDLPATYAVGRSRNTPERSFLLRLAGLQAAGFSPETVVEVDSAGTVSTQPLIGTRTPGNSPALESDPREVFEYASSVKLAVDELLTICEPASVHVTEFMTVKNRGSVQHLGGRVSGRLSRGQTAWDTFAVLFPAVAASGIPKARAYERISALEDGPRDLYAGAVFTASQAGTIDAALVLRAIYQRDGRTWLRAGAGIVGDSTPDREFEETCEKLASVAPYIVAR
ncbi:salicylate synthase [Pseudonocardiaceae bacterium YIM PH 21723]|nr:salicylate synthase [Pseudonocardiaceae bacterium YIM PH 21723]